MAGNNQAGFSFGMQGAQMGSNFGPWGALIGGAAGFAFGRSVPDNEKIMMDKYNAEVVKNAATDLFDMRRAQNLENMRTAQALLTYQDNLKVNRSAAIAQYGAADIIGSSATALQNTLDFQTTEAMNQTMLNAITGIENYNQNIDQMTNQRIASLKRFKGQQPLDAGKLVSQGVDIYKQFKADGYTGQSLLQTFQGVLSNQTPKAIEMYDPRWKNMNQGSTVLNEFNSAVGTV